jgi:tetrahydromethanopterin S-methyltransferase subunit G
VSVIEERVVMDREWTDKRMDDFVDRFGRFEGDVKERFDRVDARFDRLEGSVDARFGKIDARFEKVDERFDRLEAKVDTTNRTIWAGIFVAVVVKILFG